LTLFILLILVFPALVAFAPPRQDDKPDLTLLVNGGYNSYYRRGQWTPLRVNISNTGGDLNGYIRVRSGDVGGLEEITYRTPIDLPRGARKQVFLYVSLEGFIEDVQVEVTNRQGRVARRETVRLTAANAQDVLYAVVTGSTFGAIDLTGRVPGIGTGYQVNWRVEDIPALPDALAGLDVLMFHDIDTGDLTADQQAAITTWVIGGGHLIVTGGETWQRTTAGLQNLLPVTLQGTTPLQTMTPLADYLRLASDTLDEGMTATSNTPLSSAEVLVSVENTPVLVRQTLGGGVVDFLAVDPQAEPLRSWNDLDYLWYTLLTSTGQRPSWDGGFKNWSAAREGTVTMFSNVLPTFFQLCGFLALYIVLIGPVNYVVLKRLNRREWAWLTIPVLILSFAALAYQVGFNLRGNVPTVNRLTVVRVWPDSDQAQVLSLIGVQSPRRTTYDISVDRGYSLRPLPEQGIGLNVPAAIDESTNYTASSIPIDAGTIASFVAQGTAAAPQLNASAVWSMSSTQAPRITGRITNTLSVPLQDAVIVVKGAAHQVGTIEPGRTISFDILMGPNDPGPISIGSSSRRYTPYGYGYWSYGYGGGPGWCFSSYSGLYLTISDVMHGERFECGSPRASERQQEIRRRYRLLGALIVDSDLSGGRGSGAYLFAWTDQPVVVVDLAGKPSNEEDTTLYIFDLPVTAQTSDSWVEVPPGLTTWAVVETNDPSTMLDADPTVAFQISGGGVAAFQFMPLPDVRLASVEELVLKFQGQGTLSVELWNWQTQRWVQIELSADPNGTVIPRAERFAGPENAVNVRIIVTDPLAYNRIESIKVAFRGPLAR
jgi:hypothetical protein